MSENWEIAQEHNLDILAKLPIDPGIAVACDQGSIEFINSETPTSLSGCSLFYFGGRLPHRSLDVQLQLNEFTDGDWLENIANILEKMEGNK